MLGVLDSPPSLKLELNGGPGEFILRILTGIERHDSHTAQVGKCVN